MGLNAWGWKYNRQIDLYFAVYKYNCTHRIDKEIPVHSTIKAL
jgi:hypothetical protein